MLSSCLHFSIFCTPRKKSTAIFSGPPEARSQSDDTEIFLLLCYHVNYGNFCKAVHGPSTQKLIYSFPVWVLLLPSWDSPLKEKICIYGPVFYPILRYFSLSPYTSSGTYTQSHTQQCRFDLHEKEEIYHRDKNSANIIKLPQTYHPYIYGAHDKLFVKQMLLLHDFEK